jgi:CHAT domain-containing protein/tetratricopeptide (TPR) repeat protein
MRRIDLGSGKGFLFYALMVHILLAFAGPAFSEKDALQSNERYLVIVRQAESDLENGNFDSAIGRFKEALDNSREAGDPGAEAACLTKLGLMSWNIGQVPEAIRYYSDAQQKARESGQNDVLDRCRAVLEAISLYNAGKDYRQSNFLQRSVESFERALGISRRIKNEEITVKCLRQLSLTYWQMNDLKSFLLRNEEALESARKIKHKKEEGRCLNNIGLYHWKSTNYSSALNYFNEALHIARDMNDIQTEAESLNNIGIIYKDLGDFEKAISYFYGTLDIDKKTKNRAATFYDMINIGSAYKAQGNLNNNVDELYRALKCFTDCLNLQGANSEILVRISLLNNIGATYCDLGNYRKAFDYYFLAIDETKKSKLFEEMSFLYNNIGNIYLKLNKINSASNSFIKAISPAGKFQFSRTLWEAYYGLGQCYEKRGEYQTALSNYEKSIEVIDGIRSRILLDTFKAGFARDKLKVYERILDLLFQLKTADRKETLVEKMFSIVEKAKARAFLESLAEAKIDFKEGLKPAFKKKQEDISREISSIVFQLSSPALGAEERNERISRLGRAEDEYMRFISEMKMDRPELASLASPETCSLRRLKEEFLDERTGLAEYFLGESKSFLFFVTKKGSELFELPSREVLEKSLKGYLKALVTPDRKGFSGSLASERIAGELLFPLRLPIAAGIDRLIIVPDGVLYYLPFETLSIPGDGPRRSRYLIEDYEVSYAPSSSSLILLSGKTTGPRPKSFLGFGDPAYDSMESRGNGISPVEGEMLGEAYLGQGFDFSPLPFSKKEILDVAGHFPRKSRDFYLGREAQERVLKRLPLEDYQIVHFACHGLLDEKVPFRSALVLSKDERKEEDGFLHVREIYNLRMNADLVVLSACQTGKGSLERGEGLLGLPRIFFYAGSKAVVSALWPIGDRSTAGFMDTFYGFLSGSYSKTAALRLAKLRMIRSEFSHPFYWAAFVLNGDLSPVFPDQPVSELPSAEAQSVRKNDRSPDSRLLPF